MHIMVFNLSLKVLLLIGCLLRSSKCQSIPIGWQSSTNLSSYGFHFFPVNLQALLLSVTKTGSIFSCTQRCHSTIQCRIFDFDGQSSRCRLFEGNLTTMGSIVVSASSQSRVGSINILSTQFINYGQGCSSCQGSRYLTCINGSCQCPTHTYFDGSICGSQKLLGGNCGNNTECRSDLNYTCQSKMQCGYTNIVKTDFSKSRGTRPLSKIPPIQSARIVAGNANGVSGNTLGALNYPWGLSVGVDNALYVSDYSNQRVMKFAQGSLNGSIAAGTGVAGSGVSQLNGPSGLYVDTSLNIYVADINNFRVMFWHQNASAGVKVAGTGSSASTLDSFGVVSGLFVDSHGNIYLCDVSNNRIMKFTPNVTNAVVVGGTGGTGSNSDQLNAPYGLYLDEVNRYLYVADYNNHRIQRFHVGVSTNGTTVAGGNGQGSASNQLSLPYSVCVSKITNAIYITDSGNYRVQRWNSGATNGVTIVGSGATLYNYTVSLSGPDDIRLSNNEAYLFVSEASSNRVWSFELV